MSRKKGNSPIGGEFSLPSSPSKMSLNLPMYVLPPHTVTTSGRDAIRAVLNNWADRNTIILSAYTCDSVLNAIKLEERFIINSIDISPSLYPEIEELYSVDAAQLCKSILIIGNVFGIPYPNNFKSTIIQLQRKGLVVVEDRTHNLFSPPLWLSVDGWFASGRKWIPSAGLGLYSPRPGDKKNSCAHIFVSYLITYRNILMRVLHWVTHINILRNQIVKELRRTDKLLGLRKKTCFSFGRNRIRTMERGLKVEGPGRWDKATVIIEKLKNIDGIEIINDNLELSSLPFNVTMRVLERRDELRAYLAAKDIYLPILWSMPNSFSDKYPNSWKLSLEVLSIPVDHRYGLDQLENVVNEISIFSNHK
jgi:hypothetical protein